MDQVFAVIGRKQVELEAIHSEYDRLLVLMQQVISGEVEKDRVTVDLNKRTWALATPNVVPIAAS